VAFDQFRRTMKVAVVVTIAATLSLVWAQDNQPQWIDRNEYDLVQEINKTTDGAKKIELLNQWKQKYPKTNFGLQRLGMYLTTYQALGKAPEMLATAKEIAAADPAGFTGPYYIALLTTSMQTKDPAILEDGEKAANQLIAGIEDFFAPAKKPAGVADQAWLDQKKGVLTTAYQTLIYVATVKKDWPAVEDRITKYLGFNPNDASQSFQLGSAILAQKKPEKQVKALYHFARACALTGPGALPDANKKQACDYINRIYPQYRGDKKGLDTLMADSVKAPMPPDNLVIKTKQQEDVENLEKLKTENPQLALWVQVKQQLQGPGGPQYFAESVKEAALPKLKGKIVSIEPAVNPKKIIVGISDASAPEITITIAEGGSLRGKADPGTEIEFESIGKEYTADPFMLTVEAEKEKITGWPVPSGPAPKKAGGATVKKTVPKKK
jgi:hypothetical protein